MADEKKEVVWTPAQLLVNKWIDGDTTNGELGYSLADGLTSGTIDREDFVNSLMFLFEMKYDEGLLDAQAALRQLSPFYDGEDEDECDCDECCDECCKGNVPAPETKKLLS